MLALFEGFASLPSPWALTVSAAAICSALLESALVATALIMTLVHSVSLANLATIAVVSCSATALLRVEDANAVFLMALFSAWTSNAKSTAVKRAILDAWKTTAANTCTPSWEHVVGRTAAVISMAYPTVSMGLGTFKAIVGFTRFKFLVLWKFLCLRV